MIDHTKLSDDLRNGSDCDECYPCEMNETDKENLIEELELKCAKLEVERDNAYRGLCIVCGNYYGAIGKEPTCTECRLRGIREGEK